ncbi:hypothetical protein BV25DRAFT_1736234 [Artomyces pyxidatus]|uniref:Uncharacterized protein n=1 Tax=Artomyces pyxidatus TaxID=48021 RepID=A0ACB8SHC4_9AGAM|nr:hypothetical protein BV25DRAFT_1736234 [Artomyces pyxidatus]
MSAFRQTNLSATPANFLLAESKQSPSRSSKYYLPSHLSSRYTNTSEYTDAALPATLLILRRTRETFGRVRGLCRMRYSLCAVLGIYNSYPHSEPWSPPWIYPIHASPSVDPPAAPATNPHPRYLLSTQSLPFVSPRTWHTIIYPAFNSTPRLPRQPLLGPPPPPNRISAWMSQNKEGC